jgi:hypothetical protein
MSRRSVHDGGSFGKSARAVCRKIERAAIRFNLDDSAGRDALGSTVHEDLSDALACDQQDRAGVKVARQLSRHPHRDFYCNCGKQGNWGVRV